MIKFILRSETSITRIGWSRKKNSSYITNCVYLLKCEGYSFELLKIRLLDVRVTYRGFIVLRYNKFN